MESTGPVCVRLWIAEVTSELSALARTMLVGGEQDEVLARVGVEADRRAVSLAMRRSVLSRVAPTEASDLLEVGARGVRRVAAAPALAFSASSHDDVVAMAVAPVDALGIDVEPVHDADWDAAVEDVLSVEELRELRALDVTDRERAYFECWTVKESVMKALGDGLPDRAPDSIEVSVGRRPPALRCLDGDVVHEPWWIETIEPVVGYVLSVAVRGGRNLELETTTWAA